MMIILRCQITLHPLNLVKWMWSPFRSSPSGRKQLQRFDKLQSAHDYTEAYFTHGLAVQAAEATADYMHEHIKREMGIPENQGKRYSWGYPAIPELEDHKKVFELLPAVTTELGINLSHCLSADP